jgi:hypothetical protein
VAVAGLLVLQVEEIRSVEVVVLLVVEDLKTHLEQALQVELLAVEDLDGHP